MIKTLQRRLTTIGMVMIAVAAVISTSASQADKPQIGDLLARLDELLPSFIHNIVINEIELNSSGDDRSEPDDWIELYNRGSRAIDISGWMIVAISVGDSDQALGWDRTVVAPGTLLGPNKYLVIEADGNWLKSHVARVVLFARLSDGSLFPADVALAWGDGYRDGSTGYASTFQEYSDDAGFTWQRAPDGGCDDWRFLPSTYESPNEYPQRTAIVFTKVQYMPRASSDQLDEYVEIMNVSDAQLNLLGWILRDRDDRGQDFVLPAYGIDPGESIRIYTGVLPGETEGIALGREAPLWNNEMPDVVELWHDKGWCIASTSYWTEHSLAVVMDLVPPEALE
ncbi:lamin tail domain-containing protein [Candidatus Bipolaricaulota bacterium]|nr:lamin tail domain-containing protein [Candidatus Bipolaricaulota bacterium]